MAELGFPSWLRTALDDREPGPAVPFVDAPDEPRDSARPRGVFEPSTVGERLSLVRAR